MSVYRRFGHEVAFGDVRVAYDDAVPIAELVRHDVFPAASTASVKLKDTCSSLACSMFFGSMGEDGNETPNRFISTMVTKDSMLDAWRVKVRLSKFLDSERHSKIQVQYQLEAIEGELLEATKTAQFILGTSDVVIDDYGSPLEVVRTERKMYERPMEVADCERVVELLQRTVLRRSV